MFDNNTGIFRYNFQLELETIIDAICNISFDIGIQLDNIDLNEINEIEYVKDLFADDFLNDLSIRKSDLEEKNQEGIYNYSKEAFFSEISSFYNKKIFLNSDITDYLKGSDILFINKTEAFFYTTDEKNAKNRIISAIKNGKILNQIIDNIQNVKIKNSLNKINLFEHTAFYTNTVKTNKQEGQPSLPIIKFDFINTDKVEVSIEDFDNYWINVNTFKKRYGINFTEEADIKLVIDKERGTQLGLLIENFLIPYSNVDIAEYVLEDFLSMYYWLLFDLNYSEKSTKSTIDNPLIKAFKDQFKNKGLNQLLSYLRNNLYLDGKIEIGEDFSMFFNKVAMIEKLEYLDEYEFLIPQSHEQTALGIYSKEKKGTSYNLLHWLNHNAEKNVLHFRGNSPIKKEKHPISTLKPEICFYFLEKYFEDLLEDIFRTNEYKCLPNFKLSQKSSNFNCEIDFLVYSQNKFYFIEAKTKLSKYYIEGFLKRASEIIEKLTPMLRKDIEIEFILLGAYSDDNVKDFQYFIGSGEEKNGYNAKREDLNSIPYLFKVPIPDRKENEIVCIAEPEYDKLTKLILEICPK